MFIIFIFYETEVSEQELLDAYFETNNHIICRTSYQ
jgi:hypothetical protein